MSERLAHFSMSPLCLVYQPYFVFVRIELPFSCITVQVNELLLMLLMIVTHAVP